MTLTADQVARALGRSLRYVQEHLAADGVPHVPVHGGMGRPRHVYAVEELRRWVDAQRAREAAQWAGLEALLTDGGNHGKPAPTPFPTDL